MVKYKYWHFKTYNSDMTPSEDTVIFAKTRNLAIKQIKRMMWGVAKNKDPDKVMDEWMKYEQL